MPDAATFKDPVSSLIERALAAPPDSDERWAHIEKIHNLTDTDSLETLFALLQHTASSARQLAADALGQFGTPPTPREGETRRNQQVITTKLLTAGSKEIDPDVIGSMAVAFGHLEDERAVPLLVSWARHESAAVRADVAWGLGGFEPPVATDALIQLSSDGSTEVRDFATFGLGVLSDRNDEKARSALVARLHDEDPQVRAEALHGLARRGHLDAIPQLLTEANKLDQLSDWMTMRDAVVQMAIATQNPELCKLVLKERERWQRDRPDEPPYDDLLKACAACERPS